MRGKGAKLTFNSLGIRSPNTRRLHRPISLKHLANLFWSRRPKRRNGQMTRANKRCFDATELARILLDWPIDGSET
jgi:hypothetical protein